MSLFSLFSISTEPRPDTIPLYPPAEDAPPVDGFAARFRRRMTVPPPRALLVPHRLGLLGILLVSIFCNFWMLGQNGFGNLYYAATVKSMGSSWRAFFFASFDPAGFVSVDKPPLGFWLQVVSTKIFGFTPFAVFLPQALAGVLSVLLLYWLVRRTFGPVAGLIAAAVLAVSPISVVTNRNNTIDSTLMLALLLAVWAAFRAIETDRLRWLIVSGLLIGLGFNIKMMEAYLVVPALALAYLLSSNKPWVRRVASLLGAGALMIALSFAWVIIVDLIPAGLRPWVGSTSNDSELSLALGYNGLQRLLGMGGGIGGGRPSGAPTGLPGGGFPGGASGGTFPRFNGAGGPPQGSPGGFRPGAAGGAGGFFNIGNPGLTRLFIEPLGGQIVWFLPLALVSILALAAFRRFRPREDRQQQSLILWGVWLLTTVVFFSMAGFFHQYYLSQMAPAIAALSGIGIVTMWHQYRAPGWRGWLLPLALAVTAAEQIYIIATDSSWGTWLIPVIAIPTALAVAALVLLRLRRDALATIWATLGRPALNLQHVASRGAVTVALLALLALPMVWSLYPALTNTASDLPSAGATALVGNADPVSQVNTRLIAYLEAHQGTATYLVATPSSNAADAIILVTGKAVMALGGFTGTDPILTVSELKTLIKEGKVRYFLLNGGNTRAGVTSGNSGSTSSGASSGSVINVGGPDGSTNSAVLWVEQNCGVVPASAWGSSGTTSNSQQLYACTLK